MPLLLVGITRPAPQGMTCWRCGGRRRPAQLTGFTGAAVADLASGKPGGNLLRLADGAAGNPLYLTELVAAPARSSGLTVTGAGTAELAGGYRRVGGRVPPSWRAVPRRTPCRQP